MRNLTLRERNTKGKRMAEENKDKFTDKDREVRVEDGREEGRNSTVKEELDKA